MFINKSAFLKFFLAMVLGILTGVGIFTFYYGKGFSYFSADPKACANCHIMNPQLDSWQKSSHHTVAVCVDCHLPHDFIPKYMAKASNGYHHSKGFTLQDFQEPIQIKPANSRILQQNCLRCHSAIVHDITHTQDSTKDVQCTHCHQNVGHGDRAGFGRSYQ